MQLPGAWFDQIVGALDAPAMEGAAPSATATATAADGERRREPRVGVRSKVILIPLIDGHGLGPRPVTVPVRDISAGGIGFFHSEKVGLDAQFVALLPHGKDSVAVLCQVAYYQQLGERLFAVGARFVRVLRQPAGDEAGPMLALPARPAAPARRAAS